ncbi:uncharacterized protein M6B38_338905 [Iris pallida]|uniref:Glucose-6-phosphate dehydrogenase NAD-binding domain-containing protein n=1 Tax=Iris pallida TaxID=29817 RepID=A0AAX6GZ61_IRIPA|nr:uncharacterized protein M6B38_338905 [Iris pallida]
MSMEGITLANIDNCGLLVSSEEYRDVSCFGASGEESTVSITVVGASGDLAKKKIFPALFALFYEDCLPKNFTIFGYARSKMTDDELRNMVSRTLTCRIDKRDSCSEKMDQFLRRCFYYSGQYDSKESFAELDKKLKEHELADGLILEKSSCPLGVLLIVFESRPDALVQELAEK